MSNDWVKDIHDMQTKFGTRDAVEKMDKDKLRSLPHLPTRLPAMKSWTETKTRSC